MPDFLLELRSEEIPARMQAGARGELEKLFRRETDAAGVSFGDLTLWSTPRRLALIASGLPDQTDAVREERKGPKADAPDKAIEGFLRSAGVTRGQLETRELKGAPTLFGVIERPGRSVKDVLAEAIPAIIRDFSWPKSMRWGAASISTESIRWVRPLSGIVALLGDEIVECEVHGVTSGAVTVGHRFHHTGVSQEEVAAGSSVRDATSRYNDITIGNADDYAMKLRAAHVIVDHEERASLIREGARLVAEKAGLSLVEDEGLVTENAGLTEWPVPLLGRFDEAFLEVPPEVIQLTARVNQKYFVCEDGQGRLANAFICTANIEAEDGGASIVEGNRRVLAARLADARFFWEQDRRKTLAQHAEGLARITFHEKLGTVADKVERVAKLARWLVEEGIVKPSSVTPAKAGVESGREQSSQLGPRLRGNDQEAERLADLAEQAARLAKADLVTEMVGEFPELQGVMGGYYARDEGLPAEVADAIRDHYKPVGQGDDVPSAPVTVAVSLADKLDTLAAFFAIDEKPTGSKDPFALRRSANGLLAIVLKNNIRLDLFRGGWIAASAVHLREQVPPLARVLPIVNAVRSLNVPVYDQTLFDRLVDSATDLSNDAARNFMDQARANSRELLDFLADRLKVQQREAGVRHDLIDAVFALGNEDDLVRLLARVNALQSYIETPDGQDLLAAYKRAANILKKEKWEGSQTDGIARTGEEDPLALVDDPDLGPALRERAAQKALKRLSYTPEPAEKALIDALDNAEPEARAAIHNEDFERAMTALASLRQPIDAFFDNVTVNDPDGDKRTARLALLARFRDAVGEVADFGRIES
jgi:glycyl-tRNA synthetase beta chain